MRYNSKKRNRAKFLEYAAKQVQANWYKRDNPLFPDNPPAYPNKINEFITVEVDGVKRVFIASIREISTSVPPDAELTLRSPTYKSDNFSPEKIKQIAGNALFERPKA